MLTGATPLSAPSIVTLAPAGSDCTRRLPVTGVCGNSRYCDASLPPVIVTGMTRGTPLPRNSRRCEPAVSEMRAGVLPCATPSTNTGTPGGFVCTARLPSATGAGFR